MHMLPGPRYRVYYMNNYKRSFRTREKALEFILKSGKPFEDFEILDGSDE